ncbi:MAG: hypothetical protein ACI93R_000832 [Flavobacteriales bacterium]|jgi:hypothetical protein
MCLAGKDMLILPPFFENPAAHLSFFPKILELSLQKTQQEYGEYTLQVDDGKVSSSERMVHSLILGGTFNIMWSMTTPELEKTLHPIRVPLLKGTNGFRVFLINAKHKNIFEPIKTLEQLKSLKAGQATHWPDTQIMKKNGIPVVTHTEFGGLIQMLKRNRFDYFPRGAYEAYEEQKIYNDKLIIEERLALRYQAPIYFFMGRRDAELAKRIEVGLKIAIEDGSFDEVFFNTPGFKRAFHELNNSERLIFDLEH